MTPRIHRRILFSLLLLGSLVSARADLVLTNYSAANPIKIMAIGDSITDDCIANGAWRQYLQPLLDTNGYPFTFVGRIQSAASGSFTKTAHEGYCGAVIAPPGVSGPVHGYAATNNYLQLIVPDALSNATPDIVLVLIGANDIGRGRDPYQVATNDMSTLLDIIFSNAPNANVILTKITSLMNASVGGLNYGAYSTNVSIYNAVLQQMVNQRRALGQNVFLADMFSVCDSTMFLTDHVHLNTLGLQTMAQEWFTRIQSIITTTNLVTASLIHGGDVWKYSDTGVDLGTNWSQTNYDDSGWASGPARLGYHDAPVLTTVSYGSDVSNRYITTYFRDTFVLPADTAITNLNFRLTRVDGAVVWLNGQEAFRTNMSAGPISYTNETTKTTTGESSFTFFPTNIPVSNLPAGTNVVGVEVHLRVPNRVSMGMDLEVIGTGYILPPSLSIASTDGNVLLSWPVANGTGYSLYTSTDLSVPGGWTNTGATIQTNGGQYTATLSPDVVARFFRLQRP